MASYVIGLDSGSLSGRALVVRTADGLKLGTAVHEYRHGVMDRVPPATGRPLPEDWALQDPQDYIELAFVLSPLGGRAGSLTEEAAGWTALPAGTAVAVGNVDAHVSAPAAKATRPGQLLAVLGTSTCHVMNGREAAPVPGMCGVVDGGIIEGLWGFEAGQSGVGDIFAWWADTIIPCPAATAAYDTLYAEYMLLHDYLGRGQSDVMHRLQALRTAADVPDGELPGAGTAPLERAAQSLVTPATS